MHHAPPPPPARAPRARRAAVCLLAALWSGIAACARPKENPITAADFDRDQRARAELTAAIAEDHIALADLIATDRFIELEAIYADPQLREIALRLVERTRALRRLADTDVLAPDIP
jgi:hypothetical protein